MTEEMVDVIDENDNVIDTLPRKEVRSRNLLHRGAAIVIKNNKGELLVHKRTMSKDVFPGKYDMFVGGAVSAGENYEESAKREMEEEVGVTANLNFKFKHMSSCKTNPGVTSVFEATHDGPFKFQEEEIEEGFFVSKEKIEEMRSTHNFCDDSFELYNIYKENIK